MAVTQISTIQIRRGLAQDIGNLAAGELAWAIDTQKLYIGNGTVAEGAPIGGITEILTQNFDIAEILGTYIYKGLEGGYEVVTGVDASTPSARSFQNKIDDFVNVRDFGARGNGITDDSDAIQRALDELYDRHSLNTRTSTRRALRFNGGTYRVTKELRIPPYTTLIGEGTNSVFIVGDGTEANCVARLVTNTGENAGEDYFPPPAYPSSVFISGMTFRSLRDADIFDITNADGCVFSDVNFVGPLISPTDLGQGSSCVSINSVNRATRNIYFDRCQFTGAGYAAHIAGATSSHIYFSNCTVSLVWAGIEALAGSNIGVSNTRFDSIAAYGIYGHENVGGIISNGNTYTNVGDALTGDTANTPVIVFQADNCYSIADIFSRDVYNEIPRVLADGYNIVSLSVDGYLRLGASYTTPGSSLMLFASTAGSTDRLVGAYNKGIINYTATRNQQQRIGTIKYSTNGTDGLIFDEEYTESDDIGLVLDLRLNNGLPELRWDVNNDPGAIKFSFDVKSLH